MRQREQELRSARGGALRPLLAERVDLDRGDLAWELRGLAAGRGAEIEHALAVLRADCEAGDLRAPALRPDPPVRDREVVDALDAIRIRDVGRLSGGVAADEPHDRL